MNRPTLESRDLQASAGRLRYEGARRFANLVLLAGALVLGVGVFLVLNLTAAPWWAYAVLALGEAAFVAGCADWFAISALFRKPLGIGWHTDLIAKNHHGMARGLAGFVDTVLLPPERVRRLIEDMEPLERVLKALEDPETAARLMQLGARFGEGALDRADPHVLARAIESEVKAALREQRLSPWLAEPIRSALEGTSIDRGLAYLSNQLTETVGTDAFRAELRQALEEATSEGSKQGGEGVGGLFKRGLKRFGVAVGEATGAIDYDEAALRAQAELLSELRQLGRAGHPLRSALEGWIWDLADRLRRPSELGDAVERWKLGFLDRISLESEIGEVLERARRHLTRDEEGHAAGAIQRWLGALHTDLREPGPSRDRIANAIDDIAVRVAEDARPLARNLIVRAFAAGLPRHRLIRFVQDQVGDDLQLLRVSGVVVGGLVGLALFGLAALIHAMRLSLAG